MKSGKYSGLAVRCRTADRAERAGVDRKRARRYVQAAEAAGLILPGLLGVEPESWLALGDAPARVAF